VAAGDFFKGIYETVLSPQELLVAIELPIVRKNSAYFFQEFARRRGDYAITGLAAQAVVDGGKFTDLRMAFFAIADQPVLAKAAKALVGVSVTPVALSAALAALGHELDPHEDQQASSSMRRHLARLLMARGVASLLGRPDLDIGGHA
jgi:carbon-monoxide dehydrogenase medium subunit